MTESSPPAPPNSAGRSVALLRGLVAGGVREVVMAPGSRSAPIALAAYSADAAGDLRLHVRIDERSAAFLALGLSVGSRAPVAVVTTSGTAVGNLLPAVMEAHHSGRPLVVVSADRPERLRGTGANQTTRQAGIFGVFATCLDLPVTASQVELAQATAWATSAGGPAQLNVQFDEPLLPDPGEGTASWWPRLLPDSSASGPHAGPTGSRTNREGGGLLLDRGARTVVVAGDESGSAARLLAEAGGWPLLAEPTSGARVGANAIRTYRLLLGSELGDEVERVVVLGHPTLSRPVTRLLSRPDLEVLTAPGPGGVVTDPGRVARHLDAVPHVDDEPTTAERDWLSRWQQADASLAARVEAHVDALPDLDALHVAREVAAAVVGHATLVVGSSNPVRDLDLMMAPYPPHQHRFVVGNRGLAGIDGTVSTAVGVALGRPHASRSVALLGDVTFLHDAGGLVLGPDEPRPDLTIVVVNDDGGSIFATLEQGAPAYAAAFERVFGTPHGVDLEALCAASRTPYQRVVSAQRLRQVLQTPQSGLLVVEARVGRRDRRTQAEALRALV